MYLSHGELEMYLVDNVIKAAFKGAFNTKGLLEYISKVQSIVTSLQEKPFVMIIDNTNFEGCTADGFEELNFFNSWLNKTQLKAKAFIISNEMNKHIILNRTPSLSFHNTKFFLDYQAANVWLKKFY